MLSKSRQRANQRWDNKHKLEKKIYTYRSASRRFLKTYATSDDLKEAKSLIQQREKELKN